LSRFLNKNGRLKNMSERKLAGTVQIDSGEVAIVDPSLILQMEDFLKISTECGEGKFPVYFEKDDAEGGYGKSRIIIELGPQEK
jgi:hypothetical protein